MIGEYLRRLVAEAVSEAFKAAAEQSVGEERLSAARLRRDLDRIVVEGARQGTLAAELHTYAHTNVHGLRNLMTVLQGLLEELHEDIARQERMIEELKVLKKEPL